MTRQILECVGFGEIKNQSASVAPGQKAVIWSMKPWGGRVAFVDQLIAIRGDNQLGAQNTYIDWFMDGVREDRINREIPLATPKEFSPPLVAKNAIEFIAVNGDNISHIFQVICDGQLCKPRQPLEDMMIA